MPRCMRAPFILLLAACGAASMPAAVDDDPPAAPQRMVVDEAGAIPHEDALAHLDLVADIPAGFETRIVNAECVRLDGPGPFMQLFRQTTNNVPTLAAYQAKGGFGEGVKVESSEQWDGGWSAVLVLPNEPLRAVHSVIPDGEHDLICVAQEEEPGTIEIARKFCRSVRPR